ncbi:LysR family transcriptional regulator [Paenalcaligenes niemegkensis]|uniref:LysR family transcriptional regulator n=1 Tax=Paenalcaligenes niemegkensis TaxID=2895469 RepID=UPI0021508011|nr:LysR family transcriptional regulator [Paenalcaligenes niemegkensis]MCQ9618063.1 LysR family transcriptional regulator [Paenalcaligenes niemegkensis]
MNLRFLETFIWVAKLGSFRATANKLHLTQAAISGRIASLESELEQQLFERGSRDIQLTNAGQRVLRFSEQMLGLERDLLVELQGPVVLRGRVRLGIVESIVHTWFTSFVSQLHRIHPDVEIELTVESSMRLQDLIKRGLIDVALQTDPILAEGIRNAPMGSLEMGWVIAHDKQPEAEIDLKSLTEQWAIVTFPVTRNPICPCWKSWITRALLIPKYTLFPPLRQVCS